ncbi:MAG TPA: hypothetical protein GXX51_02160 [Firmicutes bacterium]|nr:hypothetical protein [Bacillota bacterium]
MMRHSLLGIGAGLLSVILVPLLVIVLAILVIGQAVAWALAVGYVSLLLVVAVLFKAIFGIAIGEKLLALWQRRVATLEGAGVPPGSADEHDSGKREAGRQKGISLVFAAILGAIVIYLVSLLPIIGVIVNVGAVVLTLGTLVLLFVEGVMSWPGRAS